MEDLEFRLYKVNHLGLDQVYLGPIMVSATLGGPRLSTIRAEIEELELFEFSFDFWDGQGSCVMDKKFEKANKPKGLHVLIVPREGSEEGPSLQKRPRVESERTVDEVRETSSKMPSGAGSNEPLTSLTNIEFPSCDEGRFPSDFEDLVEEDEDTEEAAASLPSSAGASLVSEEEPVKLRSTLMYEDMKQKWLRASRGLQSKLEAEGLGQHVWWIESWDKDGKATVKIWCAECKKWQGNGKPEDHSNTFSNFYRQHLPTKQHQSEFRLRVGQDATRAAAESRKAEEVAIDHRQRVLANVEILKAANEKEGSECFVIQGDLENKRLSSLFYKWQCVACRVWHNLCPKTNNLESTLAQHLTGDRHLRRMKAYLEARSNPQTPASGKVGRPGWKVQAVDKQQQLIKVFFPTSSLLPSTSNAPARPDKGIADSCLICWGLWRPELVVNGERIVIKPLLLDQLRGNSWFAEPYTRTEFDFGHSVIMMEGCFRHDFCMRISGSGVPFTDFTCCKCRSIIQERDFRNRLLREQKAVEKRGARDTGRGRRIEYLTVEEAVNSHRETCLKMRGLRRECWLLRTRLLRYRAHRRSFISVQDEFANRKDVLSFCRRIISSWRDGLWGGKEALWDFMSDVAKNLPRDRRGHRFSKNSKVIWEVVKLRAGPAVSNFLTQNLCGPSTAAIRRDVKKGFQYTAGESEAQFRHIGLIYGRLKEKYGIVGPVPFIIAEDETSIRKMCRWVSKTDKLMGFCGPKESHKCVHDFAVVVGEGEAGYNNLIDAYQSNIKGNYARVLMANPLHRSLPALLIVAMCTCNSFEAEDIRHQWNRVEKLWEMFCLKEAGPIIGHSSDGDSRRRCVQLHDFSRRAETPDREFRIGWEGFTLGALVNVHGNVSGLHDQDWIHNVKKLISPLDSTCRTLWLGPYIVRMEHIQKLFNTLSFDEHGVNQEDVDRKDRQNFRSAQILCSRKVCAGLAKMRVSPDLTVPERTQGTEVYLEIVADYVDIWASDVLGLRERIVKASKVMWFLKGWRLFIMHGEHGVGTPTVGENFISNQCFIDVVMSCHFAVLLVKLFRDRYPSFPVPFSRTGSDCCEIFFSKVGGMAGIERAYDFGDLLRAAGTLNRVAEIESRKDGVVFPRAHKKMKNVWADIHAVPLDHTGRRITPEPDLGDYSPVSCDEDIIEALKEGLSEAQKLLRILDMAPSVHCRGERAAWFKTPWRFEEPLQRKLKDLDKSLAELGDDGDREMELEALETTEEQIEDVTNLGEEEELTSRGYVAVEQEEAVQEVRHVFHEMQDDMESTDVNTVHGKRANPQVPLPGKDGEFIWKARLVSQLNGNPFLSKDRLQRVKGCGNQYYGPEELARLQSDPSIISLSVGHDIAVLFERASGECSSVASSVKSRRGRIPVQISKKSDSQAYFELGRIQIIKRKQGKKFLKQKDILDMENPGKNETLLYLYWYTPVDERRLNKFKYESDDKCWVDLATVIQPVALTYKPREKIYVLDPTELKALQEYVNSQNRPTR